MTVSKYAASMPDVQLNIKEGEMYKLEDLLYSLMLESHNDSAVAIAEHVAGSVDNELVSNVKNALSTVSRDSSQFFIMIEEGQIDKRSHDKDHEGVISTVKRFNEAVAYATQFTLCHPDTLLIVTADHETGQLTTSKYNEYGYLFHSYNHTNIDVMFFMLGAGASQYDGQKLENIELAKICAKAYTNEPFGMEWKK